MPTIVVILTFKNRTNFTLGRVEHEKFITLRPGQRLCLELLQILETFIFYDFTDFRLPRLAVTFFFFSADSSSGLISITSVFSPSESVFLALLGLATFESELTPLSVFRFLFCFPVLLLLAATSLSENISSFTFITSSVTLFWPGSDP